MRFITFKLWLILVVLFTSFSVFADDENDFQLPNPDPYEHYNRNTYRLNNKFDKAVLKPVATAYNNYIPYPVRNSVGNFFSNLGEVSDISNDVLQANVYWTFNDSWRFLINSTIGIGGLFDVASKIGLLAHQNSFGLTLSAWGAKPAPYFILPVLGPTTLADTLGMPANYFTSVWYFFPQPVWVDIASFTLNGINSRASLLQHENVTSSIALDPYVLMRSAYIQYRQQQVLINQNPEILINANNQLPYDDADANDSNN